MSKFLLPRTIRGERGYAIDLSKLKNLQCLNILTSFEFKLPRVKIFSNEYVDEVVSRMNDELEGTTHMRSLVIDGGVFKNKESMIVLGHFFSMLPKFCCTSSENSTCHRTSLVEVDVLTEILKAGLDAISGEVGEKGSTYVQSEAEANELYHAAVEAVESKFKILREQCDVEVDDVGIAGTDTW